jgi:hypothetical protein
VASKSSRPQPTKAYAEPAAVPQGSTRIYICTEPIRHNGLDYPIDAEIKLSALEAVVMAHAVAKPDAKPAAPREVEPPPHETPPATAPGPGEPGGPASDGAIHPQEDPPAPPPVFEDPREPKSAQIYGNCGICSSPFRGDDAGTNFEDVGPCHTLCIEQMKAAEE